MPPMSAASMAGRRGPVLSMNQPTSGPSMPPCTRAMVSTKATAALPTLNSSFMRKEQDGEDGGVDGAYGVDYGAVAHHHPAVMGLAQSPLAYLFHRFAAC